MEKGSRFSRLTVVGDVQRHNGRKYVAVKCDCGKQFSVLTFALTCGNTKSCGCLKRDRLIERQSTHGKSESPEFWAWVTMRQRCENPHLKHYDKYGGRGITVCDEWTGEGGFAKFLKCVGVKPSPKHSLDRIDNDGNYEPGNVRWATQAQQNRNNRRNVKFTYQGKLLCLTDIATLAGININTLKKRLRSGVPFDEAVSRPVLS